jgi:hypothetical protein
MAYTGADVQVRQFSGDTLLRFNSKLLKEIQGMEMAPMSSDRYLDLDLDETANPSLNRTTRKRAPR